MKLLCIICRNLQKSSSSLEVQESEELNVNSEIDDEIFNSVCRTCPVKEMRFVTYHGLPRQENVLPVVTSESSLSVSNAEEVLKGQQNTYRLKILLKPT